MNLPPLDGLRVFEAAARRGSFNAAAAELNLTPSAVSHRIRTLEDILGVRLFDRAHLLTQTGEIRGEDRGCDSDGLLHAP